MASFDFTDRTRAVLALAREESARHNHEYIGTEHILLALVRADARGDRGTVELGTRKLNTPRRPILERGRLTQPSRVLRMITVDIKDAKAHLSKLVDRAVHGESFIIAKAGKSLVKVTALNEARRPDRLGFLSGEIEVPDDFDTMGSAKVLALFGET